MAWLELTIDCDRDEAPRLSEFLTEAGAASVSLSNASEDILIEQDPGATPLWSDTRVRGLFAGDAEVAALKAALSAAGFGAPTVRRIEDRDWSRAWEQHVKPARYGERLWVLPTFADESSYPGVCVRLDPGLAFGTGSHPTTALCLEWLEGEELSGREVVDYGCGSGILAIAAAKLGARRVHCVDTDPQALEVAAANARLNRVERRLSFHRPDQCPRVWAEALVANIFATPLMSLAEEISALLKPGGRIALSGILSAQIDDVADAYAPWVSFDMPTTRKGWTRIAGTRRPAD